MKKHAILAALASAAVVCAPVSAAEPETASADREGLDSTGIDRARVTAGTEFNPSISVILDAVYFNEFSGELEGPAGFAGGDDGHGHDDEHEHGHGAENGFNLRETEIALSASIDNYLDGVAVLALEGESGIEVEEAYVLTRSLPAGLQIKAGRFLSDIGYVNRQHPHDWDFVDRPLVSEHLFGSHGLQENGLQLSWQPATPFYSRFGVEALQGETSGIAPYVGDEEFEQKSGPRLITGFAKFAPDLGFDHALQFGISGGHSAAFQIEEEHEDDDELKLRDGDAWFAGLDLVYKYDAGRSHGHGNWKVQAEYFHRQAEVDFTGIDTSGPTPAIDEEFTDKSVQDGLYLQTLYGFAPRWNAGLRVDALGLTNDSLRLNEDENGFESLDASYRYTAQVAFMPTEFSRLRLQVNRYDYAADDHDEDHHDDDGAWAVMLQYNMSLGAHGAHQF